jgi:hypothetical protein
MKNLVFGFIAIVLFAFNGNAQGIDELRKSNNPFNSKGEEFYKYLNQIPVSINDDKITIDELSKKINHDEFEFKTDLGEEDIAVYEKYFHDKDLDLKGLISFENYVLDSKEIVKKDKLLMSISIMKWGEFYSQELTARSFAGFEICLDRCIAKKARTLFGQSNWVEQAAFVITAGQSFAWWVASCTWDCRK